MPKKPPVSPPPYVRQDFPKTIFARKADGTGVVNKIVYNKAEHEDHAAKGWKESPAELPEEAPLPDAQAKAALAKENESLRAQLAATAAQNADLIANRPAKRPKGE
jgi:hypothetical protein